jgi:hypothetical protein
MSAGYPLQSRDSPQEKDPSPFPGGTVRDPSRLGITSIFCKFATSRDMFEMTNRQRLAGIGSEGPLGLSQ